MSTSKLKSKTKSKSKRSDNNTKENKDVMLLVVRLCIFVVIHQLCCASTQFRQNTRPDAMNAYTHDFVRRKSMRHNNTTSNRDENHAQMCRLLIFWWMGKCGAGRGSNKYDCVWHPLTCTALHCTVNTHKHLPLSCAPVPVTNEDEYQEAQWLMTIKVF